MFQLLILKSWLPLRCCSKRRCMSQFRPILWLWLIRWLLHRSSRWWWWHSPMRQKQCAVGREGAKSRYQGWGAFSKRATRQVGMVARRLKETMTAAEIISVVVVQMTLTIIVEMVTRRTITATATTTIVPTPLRRAMLPLDPNVSNSLKILLCQSIPVQNLKHPLIIPRGHPSQVLNSKFDMDRIISRTGRRNGVVKVCMKCIVYDTIGAPRVRSEVHRESCHCRSWSTRASRPH